jgi:hypothetical protein
VRAWSCVAVPAVTVPIESGRVDASQFDSHPPIALLPVPCPLVSAIRIGSTGSRPLKPRRFTSRPTSPRNSS